MLYPLILASSSPRRLELLKQINIVPDEVIPADIDETPGKGEISKAYVVRLSQEKARAVSESFKKPAFILAGDTSVLCGRQILGKPANAQEAGRVLRLLSGRRHRVQSGITLLTPEGKMVTRFVETTVKFKRLSEMELENYIQSEEWRGVAGGYRIQGRAAVFVEFVSGSPTNIIGLCVPTVYKLLSGNGYNSP